jgi:Gluconate 2-dehydrogenase subunit 3
MANPPELPVLNNARERGISRRQMVQRVLGSAGAGFALPALGRAHPIHQHLADAAVLAAADEKAAAANWTPEFLDAHQNETLIVLAERIVPGSTAAQVNRFIDLLLSVDSQDNQKRFLESLSAFEAEALSRFQHPFKDLTEDQQVQILTAASTEKPGAPEENPRVPSPPRAEGAEAPRTMRDQFENLKGWIAGAYYSSEVGMKDLGWTGQVFWDSFPGCEHPEGHH